MNSKKTQNNTKKLIKEALFLEGNSNYIDTLSLKELKKIVIESSLSFKIYKNKDNVKKVFLNDKMRDLLDTDILTMCISSHKSSVELFFNDKELYKALYLYAKRNNHIKKQKQTVKQDMNQEWEEIDL
jgi:hypothetical protein